MSLFSDFGENYKREKHEEMTLMEYMNLCKTDKMAYATAAERLLAAIGEPTIVDTSNDPRLSRIFMNRTIKYYESFKDFYGMEDTIERIVGYFRHSAQGLEEKKQIIYLLGPCGSAKSSLAERIKELMQEYPIYILKAGDHISPVLETPLGLFHPDKYGDKLEKEYGIERRYLNGLMSPWAIKRLDEFDGDITRFKVEKIYPSKLRQLGVVKTEPGDENNQDISSLVGKVDIRKLEHFSQNDPDAYSYSGSLCKGNQGVMEFVEMFKCVEKGTKISLFDGSLKNIEDIVVGDKVLSLNEKTLKITSDVVSRVWKTEKKEVYHLKTKRGMEFRAAGTHPILTNNGWKQIKDISPDDFIAGIENSDIYWDQVEKVENTGVQVEMYDIEVENNHNYIANGIVSHNSPIKMLHPLLTATQEGNYMGTENIPAIPFNGIVLSHCFSEDTELLTMDGWKKHYEIEIGDLLATMNKQTNVMEYQPALKKYEQQYHGEMIYFKSNSADHLVTPNHKMIYHTDYTNEWKESYANEFCEKTGRNIPSLEYIKDVKDYKLSSNKIIASKTSYDGKVFCFETKNHTLVARRNGKVIITGNSNESEWVSFKNNKNNEAFLDRICVIKVPYTLRVDEEVMIYRKMLSHSSLKDAICSPQTLEMLAQFSVLTRLKEHENSNLYSKMRVYNGENLKDTDPKAKSGQEYKDAAGVDEGMSGISTRFAFKVLSATFNYDSEEVAADPVHLMYILEQAIKREQYPEETEKEYLAIIKEVLATRYAEFIGKEIQRAFIESYSSYGQNLFDTYIANADAWIEEIDFKDPNTGVLMDREALNKELEAVEKSSNWISNPKDFRHEVVKFCLRYRANNNKNPSWTSYEKLREVIEKKIFSNTEELLPVISFGSKKSKEDEKKHSDFVARMAEQGYSEKQVQRLVDWYIRVRKSS